MKKKFILNIAFAIYICLFPVPISANLKSYYIDMEQISDTTHRQIGTIEKSKCPDVEQTDTSIEFIAAYSLKNIEVEIYDTKGHLVLEKNIPSMDKDDQKNYSLDTSSLDEGHYIITIIFEGLKFTGCFDEC